MYRQIPQRNHRIFLTIHKSLLLTSFSIKRTRNCWCSSVTRQLTKQDKIRYRLDSIRLRLYIDTHSWWPMITTCFVQLPACLLVTIPSSHPSHCWIGLLHWLLIYNRESVIIISLLWTCTARPQSTIWPLSYIYYWYESWWRPGLFVAIAQDLASGSCGTHPQPPTLRFNEKVVVETRSVDEAFGSVSSGPSLWYLDKSEGEWILTPL